MKKLSIVLFLCVSAFATVDSYANDPVDEPTYDPLIICCLTGDQVDIVQAEQTVSVPADLLK